LLIVLQQPSIDSQKPDIHSESRFLPTPPAFGVPIRGFQSEYCHDVWYAKTRMVWLANGKKILNIHLFVSTESMNVTDRQTDIQTAHDDIGLACIASHGKN